MFQLNFNKIKLHVFVDRNCLTLMPSKNHQFARGWIIPLKWQRSTLEFPATLSLQVCSLIFFYLEKILEYDLH